MAKRLILGNTIDEKDLDRYESSCRKTLIWIGGLIIGFGLLLSFIINSFIIGLPLEFVGLIIIIVGLIIRIRK